MPRGPWRPISPPCPGFCVAGLAGSVAPLTLPTVPVSVTLPLCGEPLPCKRYHPRYFAAPRLPPSHLINKDISTTYCSAAALL